MHEPLESGSLGLGRPAFVEVDWSKGEAAGRPGLREPSDEVPIPAPLPLPEPDPELAPAAVPWLP